MVRPWFPSSVISYSDLRKEMVAASLHSYVKKLRLFLDYFRIVVDEFVGLAEAMYVLRAVKAGKLESR